MDADEIRQLDPLLREYLGRFDDCFARRDTRAHLPLSVRGQLSNLERKSVEPMALEAGVAVRTLQRGKKGTGLISRNGPRAGTMLAWSSHKLAPSPFSSWNRAS